MTVPAKKAPVKRAPRKPKIEPPKAKAVRKPRAPKVKKPIGRPSSYTQDIADLLCEGLASGLSMRTVCKAEDMPAMATVFRWLRINQEFREQYTRAKQESADALVEEMIDICDDGTNDWMVTHDKDGEENGYKINGEHVTRSRLRVETRKWIAAKLKPKVYGEKVDVSHGVQPDNPLLALMGQMAGKVLKPVADDE
jgi:hypothetical protein